MLFIVVICYLMLSVNCKNILKIPGKETVTVGVNGTVESSTATTTVKTSPPTTKSDFETSLFTKKPPEKQKQVLVTLKKYSPEPPNTYHFNKSSSFQIISKLTDLINDKNSKKKRNINYYGNKVEQDGDTNVFMSKGYRYVSCKPYCIYDYPSGYKRHFNKFNMRKKRKRNTNMKIQLDHPQMTKEKLEESRYIADEWRNRNTKVVDTELIISQRGCSHDVTSSFAESSEPSVSPNVSGTSQQNFSSVIILDAAEFVSPKVFKSNETIVTPNPNQKISYKSQNTSAIILMSSEDYSLANPPKSSEEIKIGNLSYPLIEQLPPSYIKLLDFPNVFQPDITTDRFLELNFDQNKKSLNSEESSTKASLLSEYITIKSKLDLGDLQMIGKRKPTTNRIKNEEITEATKKPVTESTLSDSNESDRKSSTKATTEEKKSASDPSHMGTATLADDESSTEGRTLACTKGKYGGELEVRYNDEKTNSW